MNDARVETKLVCKSYFVIPFSCSTTDSIGIYLFTAKEI